MAAATTTPAPPPIPHQQMMVVFSGLLLVMLLAALDSTIVATALPTIVGAFTASLSTVFLVASVIALVGLLFTWLEPERREELAAVLGQLFRELVPDASRP